jgi:hypothetical protein
MVEAATAHCDSAVDSCGARHQKIRLKVSEYAAREGVSIRTVRRWIDKGAVNIVRIGPARRIRILDYP